MREGFRLVPRGNPSPFWTYASPVLAVVLTIVVSGVILPLPMLLHDQPE